MEDLKPRIGVYYAQNATVVTLTDEKILEDDDIKALEESIMPLIDGAVNLVIDFSSVQFLSSAVLGLLIRISKKINEHKGKLKLCGISARIYEIFKITRLDEIFDIYDDAKKAMLSLK
ncbi:MAG: STAS domain-containing protein [Planctomycetes bacterium]|nr:STAS domain-containing protein [Planctomycetota bacterium]MBU1518481.1 STAS domain-containing protein [Planctomycetota bacterium]MBU2457414.1 STAS domain-containing protein [Planctomycetota bacterium]MBU2597256.1 STAS domain-containing protein [Planctomycetota bacterium]